MGVAFMAHESPSTAMTVGALVVTVVCAGGFALLGVAAGKAMRWAFIVGVVLYAIDLVLTLALKFWLGVALHAYALFSLALGIGACAALGKLRRAQPAAVGVASYSPQPTVTPVLSEPLAGGPDWNSGIASRPQSKLHDAPSDSASTE